MHARAGVSPATRSSEQAEQRACELATPVPRTAAPRRVLAACTHDELPLFHLVCVWGCVKGCVRGWGCAMWVCVWWVGTGEGRYGASAGREAGSSVVHLGLTPRKQLAPQLSSCGAARPCRAGFFPSRVPLALAGATCVRASWTVDCTHHARQ